MNLHSRSVVIASILLITASSCYYKRVNPRRTPALDPARDIRSAPGTIAALMREGFVIDGLLNYSVRKDPNCERDCASRLVPLSRITEMTGVHIASITVSRTVDRCRRVAAYLDREPRGHVIRTFNDLWTARREGRYGSLLYTQQVPMVRGDPNAVREWYAAGMRMVQPAYSSRIPLAPLRRKNKLAGGADEPNQGLTPLGRQVVEELVNLHMILDVSHCSEQTTMDILEMTDVPILANHANAKALTVAVRGPMLLGRNKSDEELRAIAGSGGVIGVTTVAWMLDRDGDTKADIGDSLAHLDYIVKLVGIDHVGVASDSRVDGWAPADIHYADSALASPDRWRIVARRLREDYRYTDDMLRKILGLNFKRVYEQVLPGVHPPRPVDSSALALRFEPSVFRGVPEPTYEVEIEARTDGVYRSLRRLSAGANTEVDPGTLREGRYRWRAIARSGDLRAGSGWLEFDVGADEAR